MAQGVYNVPLCYQLVLFGTARGSLMPPYGWEGNRRSCVALATRFVIPKTGSTQHIATPPEEDRAGPMGNMNRNCCEVRP